ncbi:hypothetical protein T8T21_03885 [Limimaricola variabilis]|uniref:hypothetical protein n=1 Tax=Limimaricola variabilis TaxID=1492771 RepID=UPI002AC8F419|nr:hypothetical protein [Limimaricola variabilis]WPY95276.1 hypothetical protein T8T21_03885 [Limimaricola variabilis]
MRDDTIERNKGREAEWAAACALGGLEVKPEITSLSAEELVDAVWEFVVAMCEVSAVALPDHAQVVGVVERRLAEVPESPGTAKASGAHPIEGIG